MLSVLQKDGYNGYEQYGNANYPDHEVCSHHFVQGEKIYHSDSLLKIKVHLERGAKLRKRIEKRKKNTNFFTLFAFLFCFMLTYSYLCTIFTSFHNGTAISIDRQDLHGLRACFGERVSAIGRK
jgi:hypothetical protein